MTQEKLATPIERTREVIRRSLLRLERLGAIEAHGRHILIRDRDKPVHVEYKARLQSWPSSPSLAIFPNYGSRYNPFVTGIITIITAVIVTIGWGAKTLARYRYGG